MAQLEELLQQCTVQIIIPGQPGWGTGFFVAPRLIFTCAHVVKALAVGATARIRWQQQADFATAELVQLEPQLDLALLQFTPPNAALPCVYLDESLQVGQELYFFGYPDQDFNHGCPVTGSCEGFTGDVPPLIKFKQAQVRPGMSGSALLNRHTGKVCGMVKFTRDRSSDLGGGAIPTRVILEQFPELRSLQQAFHGGDKRWVNLITQPGIDFQPYLRSLIANEKYQQKWGFYTPTDAVSKIQQPRAASELDIGLMVQLMQPKTAEGDGTPKQEEKTERLPVLEGIRKYAADHVLLMGRPGSGKSTALLSLLVESAQQALADPSASILVLVELRYLDADRPSVLERIGAFLQSHALSVEEATLKAFLAEGKLLLLIDGVNELPSESARRAVARFRQDYAKTPMIFTTRDMAIGGDMGIEKKLEMQPLNESQMRQFVQAYLPEQGEPMLRQLQGRLREVGQTPLLLWMLCQVFQGLQQIPTSLGLLFRWFAGEYDKLKRDVPVSEGLRHWQTDLLQQLAFTMMQAEEPTELRVAIPRPEAETMLAAFLQGKVDYPVQRAKEWLEDLLEHHLIQPTSQNQLEFHHQLLQEYYAAEYLLKVLPTLTDDQLKRDYLNYLKWTEPLALMAALLEQEAQTMQLVRLALEVDWILGARLAGTVKPCWQEQTVALVSALNVPEWLKIGLWEETRSDHAIPSLLKLMEDSDSEVRKSAAGALGKIGSATAINGLLKLLEHSVRSVRVSAVWELGKIGSETAIDGLLELLGDSDASVRKNVAIVLGKIDSKAAIDGLLKLLGDSDAGVRKNVATVLGEIDSEMAIDGLLKLVKDSLPIVRRRAAEGLFNIGTEAIISDLLELIQAPDVEIRKGAAEALGKIGSETVIYGLFKLIESSAKSVRISLADALGQTESETAIDGLFKLAQDHDVDLRRSAVMALGRIGSSTAINILLELSDDPIFIVRRSVAEALGKIGSEVAIPTLLKLIQDSVSSVSMSASIALSKIDSEIAFPTLFEFTGSLDSKIRFRAVETLGNSGSKMTIPVLIKLVDDPDSTVRLKTAEALGKTNSELALPSLLKLVDDSDSTVRLKTAEALGKINSELALPSLLKLVDDSDSTVRLKTAEALGKINSELALPSLLKLVDDSDSTVRLKTAEMLGKINSELVIPVLTKLMNDTSSAVRWKVVEVLAKINSEMTIPGLLTLAEDSIAKVRLKVIEVLGRINSRTVIPILFKLVEDPISSVRRKAVGVLNNTSKKYIDTISQYFPHLLTLIPTDFGQDAFRLILAIQENCKYYNYEVFQAHLAAQKADRQTQPNRDPNAITIHTLERLTIMTDKAPIFNQQHATIGVNYAAEGSKVESTQHTSSSEQTFELLLTDYQQFIQQLQQKYPALADPTTVPQIIEVEAKLLEAQDQQRWQNFLNLKRLWHGSKKAGVKVGEHFAENNVWAKGAIAFLEGVSEDVK